MEPREDGPSRELVPAGSQDWVTSLMKTRQPLGILPTWEFWYGPTQGARYLFDRKHLLATSLQSFLVIVPLKFLATLAGLPSIVAWPLMILILAGGLEKMTRRGIRKKIGRTGNDAQNTALPS